MFRRLRDIVVRSSRAGHAYPAELAFMLRFPLRRLVLSPTEMVRRLAPAPAERVLELGPGPGYFSPQLAQAIPDGTLILVDLQPRMLHKVRRRLERKGFHNTLYYAADATALPLADQSLDVALLVAVLGETTDPPAAMRELYRVLRPGGRLNVTEQPGDPDFVPLQQLKVWALKVGFVPGQRWGRGYNYSLELTRPVDSA